MIIFEEELRIIMMIWILKILWILFRKSLSVVVGRIIEIGVRISIMIVVFLDFWFVGCFIFVVLGI